MGTELDYPDKALNALQLSLTEFVAVARALFPDPNQDPSAFVRFMLAGRLETPHGPLRVSINAKQDALPPSIGDYQLFRDIDSVIGVTQDLPFRRSLAIFPLPSFRDTLTQDNHVTYKIPGGFKVSFSSGETVRHIENIPL